MGKNRAARTAARNAADVENMDNQAAKQSIVKTTNNQSNKQIQLAMAEADESDDEEPSAKQTRADHRASQLPITFAQKLAHPEKKICDANLKRVKLFVQSSPSLDETGLSKLFKGIFYCYWLSDSQPVQMELAERLSSIMDECNEERYALYVRCFLEMIDREWTGIDRLRMDKFMSWVRIFFNHSLTYLHTHSWSSDLIQLFMELHSAVPLCSTTLNQRRGLFLFYTEIFLVELEKVMNLSTKPAITFEQFNHFLTPYQHVVFVCRDASLINRMEEAIFDKLIDSAESDEQTAFVKFDRSNSQQFADWFTTLAAHASTPGKYRSRLYKYSDRFTAVAQTLGKKKSNTSTQSMKQSMKQAMNQPLESNKRKQSSTQSDSISSKRQKLNGQSDETEIESSNGDDTNDIEMDDEEDDEEDDDYEQADEEDEFDEDDESDDEELDGEVDESMDQSLDQSIEDSIKQSINESIDESNIVLNDESPVEPVDDDSEVPEIEEDGANLVASADDNLFMSAGAFDSISTPPQSKKSTRQAQSAKPSIHQSANHVAAHSPSKLAHAKDAVEMLHDHEKDMSHVTQSDIQATIHGSSNLGTKSSSIRSNTSVPNQNSQLSISTSDVESFNLSTNQPVTSEVKLHDHSEAFNSLYESNMFTTNQTSTSSSEQIIIEPIDSTNDQPNPFGDFVIDQLSDLSSNQYLPSNVQSDNPNHQSSSQSDITEIHAMENQEFIESVLLDMDNSSNPVHLMESIEKNFNQVLL